MVIDKIFPQEYNFDMSGNDLLTIPQAAELLGNTVQHVRLLARTGQLKASKVGRDWVIDREAIGDLLTRRVTPPLIPFKKRGRRPAAPTGTKAEVHEQKGIYFSDKLPTVGEEVGMGQFEMQGFAPPTTANIDPRNRLNELTAAEWVPETVSVWTQKGLGASHPDAQIERQHPAPFSFSDVARLIRFFTKRNMVVLDPFVGVGSTLKACALNERSGIGIELNPRYVQLTHERLLRELPNKLALRNGQRVIEGDAREVLLTLPEDSVDFVITSPPYGSILHKKDHKARQERIANGLDTHYGDDPRDIGNIKDYETFLAEVSRILGACGQLLKPKKYMAVVVSDYRHGPRYIMFHADLARSLEAYNFQLRGITVLYQRHKRIFPYGYPFSFVPNIHHQLILVMQNEK